MPPLNIDPAMVEEAAAIAVEALLAAAPIPMPVAQALKAVLPQLLGWITTEIEGGRDPKPAILQLALATADQAADQVQAVKFPEAT